jgi:hypothetical protein
LHRAGYNCQKMTADKRKHKRKYSNVSTTTKGKIVERITAMMHEVPDVLVERNVSLPSIDRSGRTREFDVLLTSQIAGYGVRFAFECKNYAKPIGVKKIDEFIGELNDVGIPTQYAIYVSVSGYTGGAVQRARSVGMKTLTLTGLTANRLKAQVTEASQNVVYLVPRMVQFSLVNNVGPLEDHTQLFYFYNEEGDVCGFLPDLLWKAWMEGRVPLALGEHELDLNIPNGWHQIVDGMKKPVISASARVEVSAAVVSFAGSVEQHSLVDASDNTLRKFHANVSFDTSQSTYPVTNYHTESDLQTFLDSRPATVRMTVGRNKVPRIVVGPINWPPSERVMREIQVIELRHQAGEISDPAPLFADLYQGDLRKMFEPIWPDHPMLRNLGSDTPE